MIRNLRALGKTILLTTHYMDEAQNLADEVAIIAQGEIVARGTPATLGGRDTGGTLIRFRLPPEAGDPPEGIGAEISVEVRTTEPARTLHELTGWALREGIELHSLEVSRPTLEDVYLEITGGEAGAE
jgi:ABC-2 type transport system ATP-binding protein